MWNDIELVRPAVSVSSSVCLLIRRPQVRSAAALALCRTVPVVHRSGLPGNQLGGSITKMEIRLACCDWSSLAYLPVFLCTEAALYGCSTVAMGLWLLLTYTLR